MPETTALGAAMAAGFADGIQVWDLVKGDVAKITTDVFYPSIPSSGEKNCGEPVYEVVTVRLTVAFGG